MISIQESLSELERSHQVQVLTLDCYTAAIRNIAQYAVELETGATAQHRQYLNNLAAELAAATPTALGESRSTLRGLLRDYRDQASKYLNRLRAQMNATALALQETVEALSQCDGDHDASVKSALARLREVARSPDAKPLRAALSAVADCIEQSLDKLQKQHRLTISQFQSEIRLLHNRIDTLEDAAANDEATRFANRRSTAEYLRALRPGGAAVLLLKAQGLAQARATQGPAIADELVANLSRRLRNSLPKNAVTGRWGEQDFLVIVPAGPPAGEFSPQTIADHLSAPYACLQNGKVVRVAVQVSTEYLPIAPGDTPERILNRVEEAFGP